jgi:hypothetical protein
MTDTLRSPTLDRDGPTHKTALRDRVKIAQPKPITSRTSRLPVEPDDSQESLLDEPMPPSSNDKVEIEKFKKEIIG